MLGVSRDVRALLLSDTSLWTTVSLPYAYLYNEEPRDLVDLLQTAVTRSGARPIDLAWTTPCAPSTSPDAVRDLVLPLLPRALTLVLHHSYFHPGPQSFWSTPTPLLQTLTISDGLTTPYTRLKSSWSANAAPHLRSLTLPETSFDKPPSAPFRSVVHLDAAIQRGSGGSGWQHLWAWFPRLETLVLRMYTPIGAGTIPTPPGSLRRVILHADGICNHPELIALGWMGHRVRLLEILGRSALALGHAVSFLQACNPDGAWSLSFVWACCPKIKGEAMTVLRGPTTTVVIWSRASVAQRSQIDLNHARPALTDRLESLVLSGTTIFALFHLKPTLPSLSALTVSRVDEWLETSDPRTRRVYAPALEQLVVDLNYDDELDAQLRFISRFWACIEHANCLRDIVIVLPAAFNRNSRALARTAAGLSSLAHQVSIEYAPAVIPHEYPCVHYRVENE